MAGKPDKRVHKSKRAMQIALMDLLQEKRWDKITIQEIIDRAEVGRTTFYAHFQSKEDLFLSSHAAVVDMICDSFFSEDGSLQLEPSLALTTLFDMFEHSRDVYYYLSHGDETGEVFRGLKNQIAQGLAARIARHYDQAACDIPFAVLAEHVASSIIALMIWWMEHRTPYPPKDIVRMAHVMNLAALRAALGENIPTP